MNKIIITGSAGFLGKNVIESILKKGYFVYAVVRPGSMHNSRVQETDHLKKVEIDLADIGKLSEYIDDTCDAFLHLAWGGNGRNDFQGQYQNVDYTLKALDAARSLSCKRFICTGSQAEYGPQAGLTTEGMLPNPDTAYGAAKLAALYLSRERAAQLGIDWIWGRVFSVYGRYEPSGRMLPDLIRALQEGRDFPMTAALQDWDYLYAGDAAEALVALLERGHAGEIYNIANGDIYPLRYFTEQLREYFAPDRELSYGMSSRTAASLRPSVEKLRQDTGWQAKTGFMDGIRMTYRSQEEI